MLKKATKPRRQHVGGRYAIVARLARDPDGQTDIELAVNGSSGVTGLNGNTGGWQDWVEGAPVILDLGAGAQQLTATWQQGNLNVCQEDSFRC